MFNIFAVSSTFWARKRKIKHFSSGEHKMLPTAEMLHFCSGYPKKFYMVNISVVSGVFFCAKKPKKLDIATVRIKK